MEFETERVNKTIAEIERTAKYLASGALGVLKTQSRALGEEWVIDHLKDFPTPIGLGVLFEPYGFSKDTYNAGFYAFRDKKTGEIRLDDSCFAPKYNYRDYNWYHEIANVAKHPYQVVWTQPYVDDGGAFALMVTAGAGVFDENENLIAISTVDWEIEKVVRKLSEIKPTKGSLALLNLYKKTETAPPDTTGFITFKRVMDNGWLLSVQVPKEEIFAEVEEQNKLFSLITAASTVLMLAGVYYLISRLVNLPLKRLTFGVAELGTGNLDKQIEIGSKDEIGTLATAFNKMTVDLKASIEQNMQERAEKERIGAELDVARHIQASMLPCIFPPFPNRTEFGIYATMLPAKEVGGDFYDFFLIDNNTLAVVIADVSGKGVPAALLMVIAKTLIKNNIQYGKSPKEAFETVNNIMCENNEANMFVTAFMGYLDIPSGRFTFVNAGHTPPLVKRAGSNYEWLPVKPGFVLAGMEGTVYKQDEIMLNPGDMLYMYTDGVTEAANIKNELFGKQRLLDTLNNHPDLPLSEFTVFIKSEIDKFAEGMEQADDITMLVLQYAINEFSIEAKLDNLDAVLDFIAKRLEIANCPAKIQTQVSIAAEEIFVNIASYAYAPDVGSVTIRISIGEDIVIEFEDKGKPHNPLEKKDPDITKSTEEREIGGLGIFMVKKIMDSAEYRHESGKNILLVKKRRLPNLSPASLAP